MSLRIIILEALRLSAIFVLLVGFYIATPDYAHETPVLPAAIHHE